MSSLVKLNLSSRQTNYLKLDCPPWVGIRNTKTALGLELSGGKAIYLGGEKAGEDAGDVIKANQRVEIQLGVLKPAKYHVLIEANPALHRVGVVTHPRMVEPGDKLELSLFIRAEKQVDLTELDWLIRLYMLD